MECELDFEAIGDFYNEVAMLDPEQANKKYLEKAVADGLLAIQNIRQLRDTIYITTPLIEPQPSISEAPKAQPKPPKEDAPNTKFQQDATTSPYYDLTSYIDGGTESIEYIMKYKQPRDGVQLLWKSTKGDAQLLRIILKWDLPSINKCIRFKNGKPLAHGNRLPKGGGNPHLLKILQGLK